MCLIVLTILFCSSVNAQRTYKNCLEVGSKAPEFKLPILKITTDKDGNKIPELTDQTVTPSALQKENKTVVLFFSSYTWGPFKKAAKSVEELYREYKDNKKVAIYFVYIREAHPMKTGGKKKDGVEKHESIDDKVKAAIKCIKGLELTVPVLIDSMDLKAQKAYRAAYASTVVIDKEGKIAYHSRGPGGTKPKEARETLKKLLEGK